MSGQVGNDHMSFESKREKEKKEKKEKKKTPGSDRQCCQAQVRRIPLFWSPDKRHRYAHCVAKKMRTHFKRKKAKMFQAASCCCCLEDWRKAATTRYDRTAPFSILMPAAHPRYANPEGNSRGSLVFAMMVVAKDQATTPRERVGAESVQCKGKGVSLLIRAKPR